MPIISHMVELDQKQKDGGELTMAENLKIKQLLAAHDASNEPEPQDALIGVMAGTTPAGDNIHG